MKTTIQELMDEFKNKADSLPETLDANAAYLVFQECYDMAKSMLEKEKEVIKNAYIEGCGDNILCESTDKKRAEEYYNETFNTKEK